METKFDVRNGNLMLCFDPRETDSLAILMQLVLEEQEEKGKCTPRLEKDFFKNFAASLTPFHVEFGFEYLDFAIIFLEETLVIMEDSGADTTILWNFLSSIREYRVEGQTIH
ncbi:MAG: hypothetical protein A2481_02680 [Candidatus Yonathbacteria bacterium RIFOXYC2_FULL_47_9]|nr:MAG: hypothetical protein A2481_02680 [Candidatus Yonathbacteria bacterium RIFOXYC2_FULL_47_9]HAT68330.1 hypothetical protein [Candidatus Yonathbacteria bacterium]